MSAALHIAGPEDLPKLTKLVEAFHAEYGLEQTDQERTDALLPICDGIPHAVAYIIGPRAAPLGYIILSMGYSVESGGLDCMIDEFYIRANLRGRGIGTETLLQISKMLGQNGVKAIYLEVDGDDASVKRLYAKAGFKTREKYHLMTKRL